MPIEFRCGECGNLLRTPDDSGGKTGRCPSCNATMKIPAVSEPDVSTPSDASASPFKELPSSQASDDEEDSRWKNPPEEAEIKAPQDDPPPAAVSAPATALVDPSREDVRTNPYGPTGVHPSANANRPLFQGKPHKSPVIFTLGLFGLMLSLIGCCPNLCTAPIGVVGGVLGLIAIVLGHFDLKEIKAGTMDPMGRDLTQAGYWLGVVACALFVLRIVVLVVFVIIWIVAMAANQA